MLGRRAKCTRIGLDLGAASLKMLQFADGGDEPILLAAAFKPLPVDGISDEQRQAMVGEFVRTALKREPFRGCQAVVALGCREFDFKSVRLPRMPPSELASAVEYEAHDRFEFGSSAVQMRALPAGEVRHGNEVKEEILVFAAADSVVQERLAFLESIGLQPRAIDAAPCAAARCFARFLRRANDARSVNVFLDVGWRATSIIITRGMDLCFLKMIEIGGQHFNAAVCKALGVSESQAAELRIRLMRDIGGRRVEDQATVPDEVRSAVADAIRPLAERITREAQLCMRYFAVTFRGQRPDSVTLVGGEAHEPALMAVLAQAMEAPCTIGHPLRGMARLGQIGGPDRRTLQPAWVVAAGLALRDSRWVVPRGGLRLSEASVGRAAAGAEAAAR